MNIYGFTDYREIVAAFIAAHRHVRGYKKQLAAAAGCHPSYLSKAMRAECELIPDHAIGMALFWKLNSEETEYFLETVHLGRAGRPELRRQLLQRLRTLRERHERLNRFEGINGDELLMPRYYESWEASAIHILCSIQRFGTAEALAEKLSLALPVVLERLALLIDMGLIRKAVDGRYVLIEGAVHSPRGSSFSWQHLANWRQQALIRAARRNDDLHYTSIVSLSHSDALKLKALLRSFIESADQIVASSPEEVCVAINLDLFEV